MTAVKIRPLPDGGLGPLGGSFTIESIDGDPDGAVIATIVQFARWISRGMSYYQNKGGIEDSSLFKSFTAECFEELIRDAPEAAAHLTGLTIICTALPAAVADDPVWRLHRAVLARLPGVRFVE